MLGRAHVVIGNTSAGLTPGQLLVSGSGAEADVVERVVEIIKKAYNERILSHQISRIAPTAALNHWDSVAGLKAALLMPNDKQAFTISDGVDFQPQNKIPAGITASEDSPVMVFLLAPGVAPTETVMDQPTKEFLILAAAYGRNDIAIAAAVRKYQDTHPARRMALTFYEGSGGPSAEQVREILRDGIDQINMRPHTDSITPLADLSTLRQAIEASGVDFTRLGI